MTTNRREDTVLAAKGVVAAVAFIATALMAPGEWKLAWALLAGVIALLLVWLVPACVQGMNNFFRALDAEEQEENARARYRALGE